MLTAMNALCHLATVACPRGSDLLLLRNEKASGLLCLPTSSPGPSLMGGCRGTSGPPEFSPNTRRHDLPRSPHRRGLGDPLPGMDARVQPKGRPLTASSSAELWKEKDQKMTLLAPFSAHLSSLQLAPIHLTHLRQFRDQMFLRSPSIYQFICDQGA